MVLKSGKDRVFCAGANIRMLGRLHARRTRSTSASSPTRRATAIEDASAELGAELLCAVRGTAAGGGYELALAADHIMLADDGSSTVALPELPLLAVLPGTGGLTRVTDKRKVRRDLADVVLHGRGRRARHDAPSSGGWSTRWCPTPSSSRRVAARAQEARGAIGPADRCQRHHADAARAQASRRMASPIRTSMSRSTATRGLATLTVRGPAAPRRPPSRPRMRRAPSSGRCASRASWTTPSCTCASTSPTIGVVIFKTQGERRPCSPTTPSSTPSQSDWLVREILHYLEARAEARRRHLAALLALVEPGSCFAGTLAELAFASDRSFMLIGTPRGRQPAAGRDHAGTCEFRLLPDEQRI